MILVLDASAAAEIVMRRNQAERFRKAAAEAEVVTVPDLYFCEIANLFWKYAHFAHVDAEQCAAALRMAAALPDESVSAPDLSIECFNAACHLSHPAYDMFYLVLARRRGAHLATLDKKLLSLCREQGVQTI